MKLFNMMNCSVPSNMFDSSIFLERLNAHELERKKNRHEKGCVCFGNDSEEKFNINKVLLCFSRSNISINFEPRAN